MEIESPYKFLDFYDLKDKSLFFGRGKESNILMADVVVNRMVVLFARTGTGKTSLINAGVRPLLEARGYRTFYIRVEQNPTEAARGVFHDDGLIRELNGQTPLSAQMGAIVKSLNKPIVLFFDQFEEFFIQIRDQKTRQSFISDIAEAYRNTQSGVHLVFSMREEYFHEMDEFRSEIPSIFHKNSNLRLLPLDEVQTRDAIVKPAAARDVIIDPLLVGTLFQEMAQDARVNPTNLQIICDTLWREHKDFSHPIVLEEYQRLGGWRHILDKRLEDDIEAALGKTDLLLLMQHLIPELRTERNTKYPRVLSDLSKTLGTTEATLKQLTDELKHIHVIRDISISGAKAIEWASDYLAERTEYLLVRVKAIDLKRRLGLAMERARKIQSSQTEDPALKGDQTARYIPEDVLEALYMPVDEFEQLSQNAASLTDLDIEAAAFLLDSALFHRSYMKLWFDRASYTKINPWDNLQQKIHETGTYINLRLGVVRLLAELGTEQALLLLGQALNEPDLALDVVDVLVNVPGQQATKLIAQALEREDLWTATLTNLTRTGSERAVVLLEPLLDQDARLFQVLTALERLAKSGSHQASSRAWQVLEKAVARLEKLAKQDEYAGQAEIALKRLASSNDELVAAAAKKAQKRLASARAKPQEPVERLPAPGAQLDTLVGASKRLTLKRSEHVLSTEVPSFPGSSIQTNPREKDRILRFISQGKVIPVISDSFRIEQIFRDTSAGESPVDGDLNTVEELLTAEWARSINYPMMDIYNRSRVAGYYLTEEADAWAKQDYVNFLKQYILEIGEEDIDVREVARELKSRAREMRFSEIVRTLDYPRFTGVHQDSFRLLAKLPLPIYVTTSYYDFMEQALIWEDKQPVTQVCLWTGSTDLKSEHRPDPGFRPTPSHPAVYHLYGLEEYPQTMVLSDDDHLNFLKNVAADDNTIEPIIPLALRQAFAESSLLMLGYQQQNLDFRILFNVLTIFRRQDFAPRGLLAWLVPTTGQPGNKEKYQEYLRNYFERYRLGIEWSGAEQFIDQLWMEWENYRFEMK